MINFPQPQFGNNYHVDRFGTVRDICHRPVGDVDRFGTYRSNVGDMRGSLDSSGLNFRSPVGEPLFPARGYDAYQRYQQTFYTPYHQRDRDDDWRF
jgi:hypothetical protein